MFAYSLPTFPPDKDGHESLEGGTYSNANATTNALHPDALLMEDFDVDDTWLDSFKEPEPQGAQHQSQEYGQAETRVHGGNAWADATRPMPIAGQGQFKSIEELASFESSQSVLRGCPGGSYTEDSVLIRQQSSSMLKGTHYGSAPVLPLLGHTFSGEDVYTDKNTISMPSQYVTPPCIPAPGGHWAWVPSSKTNPAPPPPVFPMTPATLQTSMSMPLLTELQGTGSQGNNEGAIDINTNTNTDMSFGAELDLEGLELLDSLDFMDVADTLVGDYQGQYYGGPSGGKDCKHMFGSAPLPAVLEDSVSGGGEASIGSGNSMPSSEETPPPGAMPIPMSRRLRSSSSSGTLSMQKSASTPNLLPSSYPSMERPVRTAARRSMALAAAALRDIGTSSESEEDMMRDDTNEDLSSYGRAAQHLKRSSGGLRQERSTHGTSGTISNSASAALGKKKHNPWSVEETNALIEGVRLLGVGKWAEIKRLPYPGISKTLETRSPVDLKDKWRNLNRVARISKSNFKSRFHRAIGEMTSTVPCLAKGSLDSGAEST